jgi:hypothetical protein
VSLPAGTQITFGQHNSDMATLTGNATAGSPTGTVAFYECGPTAFVGFCFSQANPVGGAVALVSGPDDTATASSPSFTPTATGFWCFAAYYSGDTNYQPSSDTATDGCFEVNQASEATSTSMGLSLASVTYGSETTEAFGGTVIGQPGDGVPKGIVTISSASTPLCSASLGTGSGDSVSYSCSLTVSALGANTYSAVASTYSPAAQSSSDSNFTYTSSNSTPPQSFAVSQANQTLMFTSSPPGSAVVSGPTYAPTAIGGASGNPVVISVDGESAAVCSISGGVVSFTGAGTCIVDADQSGNSNYQPALQAKQSILVTRLMVSTMSLPSGAPKQSYTSTLTAIGGKPPYMWSLSSGILPKGLHLGKSTGVIGGRPSARDHGTYTFTVRVADKRTVTKGHPATQDIATKVLSITIL